MKKIKIKCDNPTCKNFNNESAYTITTREENSDYLGIPAFYCTLCWQQANTIIKEKE